MATTFVKDNQQFKMRDPSGNLVPVTDERTLTGLYGGSTPYSTIDQKAAMAKTTSAVSSTSPIKSSPPTSAPAVPNTSSGPTGDPLTKMNFAIAGMLTDAKMGQIGINQNQTQGNQQIKAAAATSDMSSNLNTGAPVAGLSPSQQNAARGAEAGVFDASKTNFNDKLNFFSKNISDITSALGSFSDMATITLNATLTPQAIQGALAAYAAGDTNAISALPPSARSQVYAALAENPDIVKQHEESLKRGVISGPKGSKYIVNPDGSIQVLVPGSDSSGSTVSFQADLKDALGGAGIVNGQGRQTFVNGKEVTGKDGKLSPEAAVFMYNQLLSQYPSKGAQIKANIKPHLNPSDYGPGGDPQLQDIFGVGN